MRRTRGFTVNVDHFIECVLIAGGAQRAGVLRPVDGFQRRTRVEHAATTGAQYIPRQLEQAQARGVQERGNHALLVQSGLGGKVERIDSAQLTIGCVADQRLDGGHDLGIGRLPQGAEQGWCFAHKKRLRQISA
jgi:hypothetical protein